MSAFAEALGGLAQDYGQAGILKQRSDLAQNEMQLRTAHEALYDAIAKKQLQQSDLMAQTEARKAAMPLFIGQPYSVGGKRYQDTWDIQGGKPSKLELGPEETPAEGFIRQFTQQMGRPPDPDEKAQILFHQFGTTPPKQDKPTVDYELKQDKNGRFVYMPKDPANGKAIPSDIIGKLAESQNPGPAPSTDSSQPLPNPIDERYAKALANKEMNLDQLAKVYTGKALEGRRLTVVDRAKNLGFAPNDQTTPAAQTVVMKTTPVLQQVDRMLADISNLKLDKNNTPGYLASSRAKYALGIASPEGSLGKDIAGLSLGSVVEAASALGGSSRAYQALQIALQHTPNAWVDSPALIKQKLTEIRARLQDIVDDAQKFGTKSGLPNTGSKKPQVKIGPDGSISIGVAQ